MPRLLCAVVLAAFALLVPVHAQPKPKPEPKGITATPAEQLKVAKGFKVELLYSVPKEKEGSWVCMTTLPDGRLVVSDQYDKGMYVVTPSPADEPQKIKVEPLGLKFEDGKPFGMAQGLCWAFDALYVVVNGGKASGLYRVTDSDKDGKLDKVELLRAFEGHNGGGLGEHGPHAVLKHPDGKRLTVVCGNQTKLTKYDRSAVPENWGEDHLLPRLPDGNGFMAGVLGPGGAIYNVTPDGKTWELHCVGFRNQYDAAYNRDGDLLTYDADMEWDVNTPWYRPTRVCLAVRGGEFGWRNGAGKYPAYYTDNLPAIVDIGPGSPTGVTFGYGAKFPAKYQDAMFICDWSYGKMYAVHLSPDGASYKGTTEEFVTGAPLPLTDLVVSEKDGTMYFTTGGRKVQSGLYRVTYTGTEDTKPVKAESRRLTRPNVPGFDVSYSVRASMEDALGGRSDQLTALAGLHLTKSDRYVRFLARANLENQKPEDVERLLASNNPDVVTGATLALTRSSASCPQHDAERKKAGDPKVRTQIFDALAKLDFAKLTVEQRLDLTRVYHVFFNRFGPATEFEREAWLKKYESAFPTGNRFVDGEMLQVFVYLQGPKAAAKGVKLLADAPTQEEQMEYARALRMLKEGWTPELRKAYFEWFIKAQTYKGGNSFAKFVLMMKADAEKTLTDAEKVALKPILEAKPAAAEAVKPRPFVKKHTLDDLAPKLEKAIAAGGRDFDKGRKLFGEAKCFSCHRYDQEGGAVGPDLTGVNGRFNQKDLLESVLDPSKEVSDQYQAVDIDTLDGKKVSGRIVNLSGDDIKVMVNMLDPNGMVNVKQSNVDRITPSKVSMMPTGLLDTLTDDEVFDLMAYLLSKGDRKHPAFKK